MDETPEVLSFAETLERSCLETVEAGQMTKDLALLAGPDQEWLNSSDFLNSIQQTLDKNLGA